MNSFLALLTLTFAPILLAPAHHPCLLGLSLNVSVNGGVKELTDSVHEEQAMGCDMMASPFKWSDLEPAPGQFRLDKLEGDLRNQAQLGFTPILTVQTIDTDKRTLPTDLASEPWDSAKMLSRERSLLEAIGRVLPNKLNAVMLGNEVDGYLSNHPSELKGYVKFLAAGREILKAVRPMTQVGVVTMFTGLSTHKAVIESVQSEMDIVAMTYYPIAADFKVLPVSDVRRHFDQMVSFAGSRKLYLQEVGYPASPIADSSDAKQAAFVDAMFDEMTRQGSRLYGVCYFLLVDFNDKLLDQLMSYYSLSAAPFRAMLGTLGLKTQFGAPRPAWAEFKKRAMAF